MSHTSVFAVVFVGFLALIGLALNNEAMYTEELDTEWKKINTTQITSVQDNSNMEIFGYWTSPKSDTLIDFQYVEKTKDGGYKKKQLSKLYKQVTSYDYPGSEEVTLYEDIDNKKESRIEIYECQFKDKSIKSSFSNPTCPSISDDDNVTHKVSIYVPKGTVTNLTE